LYPATTSFATLRQEVIDPQLCTGCGGCQLACPEDVIRFDGLTPRLRLPSDAARCGSCTACVDVCPGARPDTLIAERRLFGRGRRTDERWIGIHEAVFGGRAKDPHIFKSSASGGSTTALLRTAKRDLELDAILVMGREQNRGWRTAPVLCEDADQLVDYAQSSYQIAPYLGQLRQAMYPTPRSVAIVGLACHMQAIRKLQTVDTQAGAWARQHIRFLVEIGCSSGTTPEGTRSLIEELLEERAEDVALVRYRTGDYPGEIAVDMKDGRRLTVPFWRAVKHFARNKTHRCLSCGDWISGLADVSVSDGDPNIFAASVGTTADPDAAKHGRLFVRTPLGKRIVEAAVERGELEVWDIQLDGFNLGLERKRNRRASYERGALPFPDGPIPGFREQHDVVDDAMYLDPTTGGDLSGKRKPSLPRALWIDGRRGLQLRSEPVPQPEPGQVRIRTSYSLVSPGTELHYLARYQEEDRQLKLGYCSTGVIDAVGRGVDGLERGQRVLAMGWGYATHAEFACVPMRLCVTIPTATAAEHGVFAGIAATALHGLHRARLGPGDRALVVGCGLVGQMVARLAVLRGAHVCAVDVHAERLRGMGDAIATRTVDPKRGLYASLERVPADGYNHVLLCVAGGGEDLLGDCLRILGPEHHPAIARNVITVLGRLTATVPFSVDLGNIDIRVSARCGTGYRDPRYVHGEVDYPAPPGEATVDKNLETCIGLIADGSLDVTAVPLLRVPLDEATSAYAQLQQRPEYVGALFRYANP
jgi:coenzyme F420 hydrogenase subunit beta